jgi:hypothetical protein
MRNPTFLLAFTAAVSGAAAIIIALVGTHGPLTWVIVAVAAVTTLGGTTRAIRNARQPNA